MKLPITRAEAHVRGEFYEEGSVLRGTVESGCAGIQLNLTIESPAEPDRIAALVRNAERMCFVGQAVVSPVSVSLSAVHNGQELPYQASPDPEA